MNFQQLRAVREAVRRDFNLTGVAAALHASQPGISRQIRDLESELGVELFMRQGKRLVGLTEGGQALLPLIDRMLTDADSLRRVAREQQSGETGSLTIAATHSQARYALPQVVRDFRVRYPKVSLHLHQGSPQQVAALVAAGEADIGVATEALADVGQLVTFPCYRWSHSVVVPAGHPLLECPAPLTLADLAAWPIITYAPGYTGRAHLDAAFAAAGVTPEVALTAMDADVIKTYVGLGLGVGIVAAIALDDERDIGLQAIDARHLFAVNQTLLAVRRDSWLRGMAYAFIETFVPTLTRAVVEQTLHPLDAAA